MSPEERLEFCANLASVELDHTRDKRYMLPYFEVLLQMANSQIWRRHLLLDQWRTLEFLSTRFGYIPLLRQCIHNEALVPSLSELRHSNAITKLWLQVVWRQSFENLPQNVVTQIRNATYILFCREGKETMKEFEELINLHHHTLKFLLAADDHRAEREMDTRRRESMFQELCHDVELYLHDSEEHPSRLVASPARMDSILSDE